MTTWIVGEVPPGAGVLSTQRDKLDADLAAVRSGQVQVTRDPACPDCGTATVRLVFSHGPDCTAPPLPPAPRQGPTEAERARRRQYDLSRSSRPAKGPAIGAARPVKREAPAKSDKVRALPGFTALGEPKRPPHRPCGFCGAPRVNGDLVHEAGCRINHQRRTKGAA